MIGVIPAKEAKRPRAGTHFGTRKRLGMDPGQPPRKRGTLPG
ncbi:hypothetical protein L598_002300000420 [Mesorhizobium sp. J18]|nr:hypothetical protein L598_002300000420 [Mesorhizobium sp. J18]